MSASLLARELGVKILGPAAAVDAATRDAARTVVSTLSAREVAALAVELLLEVATEVARSRALAVEAAATRRARPPRRPRSGTRARAEWDATPEGREFAAANADIDRWVDEKLDGALRQAIDAYTEAIKVEWSAELLASSFALGDGSTVTWGEATVDQHRDRRQLFLKNAHGNLEGAARHEAAIRELERAGAQSLFDLTGARWAS